MGYFRYLSNQRTMCWSLSFLCLGCARAMRPVSLDGVSWRLFSCVECFLSGVDPGSGCEGVHLVDKRHITNHYPRIIEAACAQNGVLKKETEGCANQD